MDLPLAFGWRDLLFENWPVDAGLVAPRLPERLSIDTYDDEAWLTAVPFVNVRVRHRALPAPLGVRLPELNLRTYVTCDGTPGVYFFSLDAQGLASVLGARLTHYLPYYYARGSIGWRMGRVEFESRRVHPGDRAARYSAAYRPAGHPFEADPDSLAHFLVERRRLFAEAPDGSIRHTAVEHEPYTLYPATASIAENTLLSANGFDPPAEEPTRYFSPGVDVTTTASRRWTGEP